ncbi:MAG TPA: D-2-hydroxyacid dehydrogenase [Burkholderiales bacterium]|nr:D-2-hydroxyacid dehydrogenase [Burkholderiales bacterium]
MAARPVTALLVSHQLNARFGARIAETAAREKISLELVVLPADAAARLTDAQCGRVEAAFFSGDVFPDHSRQFFSTVRKAPRLAWLHVFNVGVDHPIYTEMLQRGVRLTTSAGSTAEPIAQTAIMGLLALARGLPHWLAASRRREWSPLVKGAAPRDLKGQTVVILGLGKIGTEIARLARALGLTVIGVRRGPRRPGDPVDELHPPAALSKLAARCDWLVIACPLTPETRGLIDESCIASLPRGARLINIARGEIVNETALIAALRDGHLAGAYLDVFETEPLPPASPLWDLPNVIVTPHNSAAAAGNDGRVLEIFLDNLVRWRRGEPLQNEVQEQ